MCVLKIYSTLMEIYRLFYYLLYSFSFACFLFINGQDCVQLVRPYVGTELTVIVKEVLHFGEYR